MASIEDETAIKILAQAIADIKKELGKFDKTYPGHIAEVLANNLYKVEVNHGIYTLPCSAVLKKHDKVRIRIPCNNMNDMYMERID